MRIENKTKKSVSKNSVATIFGSLIFVGALFFGNMLPPQALMYWTLLAMALVIVGAIGEASKEIIEALEKTSNTSKSRETLKNRQTSQ